MTDTPERPAECWPPRDSVAKLVEAVTHLLDAHDCDTDGYEQFKSARDVAATWLASSLGEPVSQEVPVPDTLTKQSRHCNMCDRPEVCDRILPNTGPCGMNDGTPVISSASPLSEDERQDITEIEGIRDGLRKSAIHKRDAARATPDDYLRNTWNDWADEHDRRADFWQRIIARLSASAPSPEDKGSEL